MDKVDKMDKIINITINYGDITKFTNSQVSKINNKSKLIKLIGKELEFLNDKKFIITRKSKRSKNYVLLKNNNDFRALSRSLEVKNHLKLKIYDNENENENENYGNNGNNDDENDEKVDDTSIDSKTSVETLSVDKNDISIESNHDDKTTSILNTKNSILIGNEQYNNLINKLDEIHDYVLNGSKSIKIAEKKGEEKGENKGENKGEQTGEEKAEEKGENVVIHSGVYCDVCNPLNNEIMIKGDRYRCKICFDYDLCSNCYKNGNSNNFHLNSHPMEKIVKPRNYKSSSFNSSKFTPTVASAVAPAIAPVRTPVPVPSFAPIPDFTSDSDSDSAPASDSASDSAPTSAAPESKTHPNCIFVDIPVDYSDAKEYGIELMDLVEKFDDLTKLKKMKKNLNLLNNLLELTNNDENLLKNIVNSYIDSENQSNKIINSKNNTELIVQITKIDQTLAFNLQNKSCILTPKNLNLILTYLNKDLNLTKFSLSIGPHSIYPNGHKRLYYNMNGLENKFDFNDKFTIELIDEENNCYASGICIDGSGIVKLNDSKSKDLLTIAQEESSSSSSSSSNEAFVTPSSSTYVNEKISTNHQDNNENEKIKESNKDNLIDKFMEEFSIKKDDKEKSNSEEDIKSIIETIRSSTMTLTPQFVEINQRDVNQDEDEDETETETETHSNDTTTEEICDVHERLETTVNNTEDHLDFTDDDYDEVNSFNGDDYEVLSTDDYTD